MGIIDRLSTLIRSNINDLISRAENPQKVLEQLIVDMRSQLAKAKQQVAAAIADEKRLSAQAEQEKKLSEDWEKRAVLAVQEGRDDLGRAAAGEAEAGASARVAGGQAPVAALVAEEQRRGGEHVVGRHGTSVPTYSGGCETGSTPTSSAISWSRIFW